MAYWMNACTQCREKFKEAMDENFEKFEKMFNGGMTAKSKKE